MSIDDEKDFDSIPNIDEVGKVKRKSFIHNNRHLEVRAAVNGDGWSVRVFEGDKKVTRVIYNVSFENQTDAAITQGVDLVADLMFVAENDVTTGKVKLFA